jgi:EAL domain-containing protein (putative c-di-GMP-specific phosphodiesterase class I)
LAAGHWRDAAASVLPLCGRKSIPTHVVLELDMPDGDGVGLLRFLAEIRAQSRIIVMSTRERRLTAAVSGVGTKQGLDMAGALQKPLQLVELEALLADTIAGGSPSIDELAAGIAAGQLTLLYQPKIRLVSGGAVQQGAVEALVRWRHPTLGLLTPDKFLRLAEQGELMGPLTDVVAAEAFKQMAVWRSEGANILVSINVPPQLLADLELPDKLEELARLNGVPTESIAIEVTETGVMADPLRAMEILTRFRLKGFTLSLDDFGTGFSSVAQLYRMPFSEVKIDRSFVRDLDDSDAARSIVLATADLGHRMDLSVCAEGIEGQESYDFINELGCETAQGYLFSRPIEPHQVLPFFARWLSQEVGRGTASKEQDEGASRGEAPPREDED